MRILLLSQWFPPEPDFRVLNLARGLAQRGHEVVVVTGFPNYPGGRLYPGYSLSWRKDEWIEGIRVVRVPLVPSHSQSVIGRIANYASFGLASAVAAVLSSFRADVAYVYHPPITVGLSATLARRLRGVPFVLDVQDLWPDTLAATRMISSPAALSLTARCCSLVYRHASKVAVQSTGFRGALIDRGVDPAKIDVIVNWCDEESFSGAPSDCVSLGPPGKLQVLFAGNLGRAQGLDTLLTAAELLQSRNAAIDIHLMGDGLALPSLRAQAVRLGLRNVHFLPRVSPKEVARFLRGADVLVVSLVDDPLFAITVPSKIQAYMYIGKPIVLSGGGDAAALVSAAGCGRVCMPGNPAALAASLEELLLKTPDERVALGTCGTRFYQQHMGLTRGVCAFERLLCAAAGQEASSR